MVGRLLSKKNAPTVKHSFENILISSKRKPNLIESDRGKDFYNKFQNFLINNHIEHYSRNTSVGAVFAKRFKRTIEDLPKKIVFERKAANWIDVLPKITKQNNNRVHLFTKLMPIQTSPKKNEGYVYKNLSNNIKKVKAKDKIHNLVRVADLKKTFSKGDRTKWSYKLYKITDFINDTMPSSCIDILKERYNQALLKKTDLTMKKK